jgi:hypothetical protein
MAEPTAVFGSVAVYAGAAGERNRGIAGVAQLRRSSVRGLPFNQLAIAKIFVVEKIVEKTTLESQRLVRVAVHLPRADIAYCYRTGDYRNCWNSIDGPYEFARATSPGGPLWLAVSISWKCS